jgi:hypothetical protein
MESISLSKGGSRRRSVSNSGFGNVVEIATEEETYRPRLQMLVTDEGEDRFWLIYCLTSGVRVLLSTIRTSVTPYIVVV